MRIFVVIGGAALFASYPVSASASPFEQLMMPRVLVCTNDQSSKVIEICTASIEFFESHQSTDRRENAEVLSDLLVARGRAYLSAGQYDQAIADFSDGIERLAADATITHFYKLRGYAFIAKGLDELAIRDFDRYLAKAPADLNSTYERDRSLAVVLYGRGLARRRAGIVALGNADIAAAEKVNSRAAKLASQYLIKH